MKLWKIVYFARKSWKIENSLKVFHLLNFLTMKLTNLDLVQLYMFISQFYIHPLLMSWQIVRWQNEVAKIPLPSTGTQLQSVWASETCAKGRSNPAPRAFSLLFLEFRRKGDRPSFLKAAYKIWNWFPGPMYCGNTKSVPWIEGLSLVPWNACVFKRGFTWKMK